MNLALWILQILAALLYAASGVMKTFLFEKVSADVPSFGALPRGVWKALGVLEMVCAVGLVVPDALHWMPMLTVAAASVLVVESLLFLWVHSKYKEIAPIVLSCLLGLVLAFVVYGRMWMKPIG